MSRSSFVLCSIIANIYPLRQSPPDQIRRIVYRCATFLLHPRTGRFVQNTMWKDRHAVSADAIMQGLTRDEAHERLAVFDVNAIVIPEKTTMQLLVDEVCTVALRMRAESHDLIFTLACRFSIHSTSSRSCQLCCGVRIVITTTLRAFLSSVSCPRPRH